MKEATPDAQKRTPIVAKVIDKLQELDYNGLSWDLSEENAALLAERDQLRKELKTLVKALTEIAKVMPDDFNWPGALGEVHRIADAALSTLQTDKT